MASSVNTRPLSPSVAIKVCTAGISFDFSVDDLMGEDDLMVDRKRAEDVRCLAVRKGVEALPQRLPVDRDEPRRGGGAGLIEPFRMASERPLQFGRIEC